MSCYSFLLMAFRHQTLFLETSRAKYEKVQVKNVYFIVSVLTFPFVLKVFEFVTFNFTTKEK